MISSRDSYQKKTVYDRLHDNVPKLIYSKLNLLSLKQATMKQKIKNSNEKGSEFDATTSIHSTTKTQSKKQLYKKL